MDGLFDPSSVSSAGCVPQVKCRRTWIGWRLAELLYSGWVAEVGWHVQAYELGVSCRNPCARCQEPVPETVAASWVKNGVPSWWFWKWICRSGLLQWRTAGPLVSNPGSYQFELDGDTAEFSVVTTVEMDLGGTEQEFTSFSYKSQLWNWDGT